MAIDFTLPPEVLEARDRIRSFFENERVPTQKRLVEDRDPKAWRPDAVCSSARGFAPTRQGRRAAADSNIVAAILAIPAKRSSRVCPCA